VSSPAPSEKPAGAKPGPATSEKATPAPAAPPPPLATPILKIRSTDGAAVADVHNGVVRVRLGDKTLEAATIIISLDSGAGAGTPRKGIALTVRDGAVRMTAKGTETIGAVITIHPDGRTEVRSREATGGPLKEPAPAGAGAVRKALIVAPTSEKRPPAELKCDWSLSGKILRQASRILVFGFAFNEYDQAVIGHLIHAGRNLVEVVIVDVCSREDAARRLWPRASIRSFHPSGEGQDELRAWLRAPE